MPEGNQHLLLLGYDHRHTPLEARERLALSAEQLQSLRSAIPQVPHVREFFVLQTCNRLEITLFSTQPDQSESALRNLLCQLFPDCSRDWVDFLRVQSGLSVIEHTFALAAGLYSERLGETEILGQLKDAYRNAQQSASIGPTLHLIYQKAFQAAKWARTHTSIGLGQISLGNVAVDLARRIFGPLTVARTLVIGSGEVGRDVAKAFQSRGNACISIANRTPESARQLAKSLDGLVIPFSTWQHQLIYSDIAIFATSSPEPIATPQLMDAMMGKRPLRPLFLIDLAVPRNIDPAIARFDNVFLYNFQDLSSIANENLNARKAELDSCLSALRDRASRTYKRIKPPVPS